MDSWNAHIYEAPQLTYFLESMNAHMKGKIPGT